MKKWLRSAVQFCCIAFVPGLLFAQTARIQLIHNSADTAAQTVDLYLGTELFQNDLAFRQATPFRDVTAGAVVLGVAPGNSTSSQNAVATFNLQLNAGTSYVGILNGVLNTLTFAANPDTINIALTLLIKNPVQEQGTNPADFEFFMVHGITDAPAIQVGVQGNVNNLGQLKYGAMSAYVALQPAIQTFMLTTVEGTGTDDGADTGVDDGEDTGVDDGADTGVDDGEDTGVDDGADTGVDDGEDTGVDDGADTGVDDGADTGVDDGADTGADDGADTGVDDSADGVDDGTDDGTDDSADGVDDGTDDSGGTAFLKRTEQQAVFQFTADLSTLAGSSAVLIASGFLNPAANQNGPGLDVLAVLANGQVISFGSPTSVKADKGLVHLPGVFNLEQNFPNPFNPSTMIAFSLPATGQVSLEVYDTSGRLVRQLVNDRLSAGRYEVSFSADNLGSGIYFYRLRFGNEVHTRRMLYLK